MGTGSSKFQKTAEVAIPTMTAQGWFAPPVNRQAPHVAGSDSGSRIAHPKAHCLLPLTSGDTPGGPPAARPCRSLYLRNCSIAMNIHQDLEMNPVGVAEFARCDPQHPEHVPEPSGEGHWNLTQEESNALFKLAHTAQEWLALRKVTRVLRG
jgi:hypothetical protein